MLGLCQYIPMLSGPLFGKKMLQIVPFHVGPLAIYPHVKWPPVWQKYVALCPVFVGPLAIYPHVKWTQILLFL